MMNHHETAFEVMVGAQDLAWPDRRQLLRLAGLGLIGLSGVGSLGLAGCASSSDLLNNIQLTRQQLLAVLSGQFPLEKRVFQFFDVGLSKPQLDLQPADNRLMTGFDMSLGETSILRKVFTGSLGFGSGVRYEASDHSIRLARVQVSKLDVAGLPSTFNSRLTAIGNLLAETVLENMSVYKMPAKISQLADTLGYAPGELKVTSTGLAVPFVPIQRG